MKGKTKMDTKKIRQHMLYVKENGLIAGGEIIYRHLLNSKNEYIKWIRRCEMIPSGLNDEVSTLISIVVPVYNAPIAFLQACIDSVKKQTYSNWELCLADDCSTDSKIKPLLSKYAEEDSRIKVVFREKNGHISEATNSAIELATGDYIAFMDNDDVIVPHALQRMVETIEKHPDADVIYSDEDKLTTYGRRIEPYFKPDWSPDTLMTQNYICHFTAIRRSLVEQVGGLEKGLEGSQDYDLILKCTEKTSAIYHIPEILYHWRMLETSTANSADAKSYAYAAGQRALENAIERRGLRGKVTQSKAKGNYLVEYDHEKMPLVSVVLLRSSQSRSIFSLPYVHEVLPIDIRNTEEINQAVIKASGDVILVLSDRVEMTSEALKLMADYAVVDHVGAVGVKLMKSKYTVDSAGLILGVNGIADKGHHGYYAAESGYFGRLLSAFNVSALPLDCLMVSKAKWLSVGGLEEKGLKHSFQDIDLCLKLQNKGYNNLCIGQIALQKKSQDNDMKPDPEDTTFMIEKWEEFINNDPCYSPHLTRERTDFGIRVR